MPLLHSFLVNDKVIAWKTVEVIDLCLLLLEDDSHTVINASLECLNAILSKPNTQLREYLVSDDLAHMQILRKKRTIRKQILKRRSSMCSSIVDGSRKASSTQDEQISLIGNRRKSEATSLESSLIVSDDKILLTSSDIEIDAFKSGESDVSRDTTRAFNSPVRSRPMDNTSLTSQKSTDSIGSFFSSILTHPNAESVTKLFRVGSLNESTASTSSKPVKEDNVSVISLGSQTSTASHNSSNFDLLKTGDDLPEIEVLTDYDINTLRMDSRGEMLDDMTSTPTHRRNKSDIDDSGTVMAFSTNDLTLQIGQIGNQSMVSYATRLIASKFLLKGFVNELIDDQSVRVSIKNLSMIAIGHCVALSPSILGLPLEMPDEEIAQLGSDESDSDSLTEALSTYEVTEVEKVIVDDVDVGEPLDIKDDHFGESHLKYLDFVSPLSKSADPVLLGMQLTAKNESTSIEATRLDEKLRQRLDNQLSKSDIVDSGRNTVHALYSPKNARPNLKFVSRNNGNRKQLIEDILLFINHEDPTLQANVQMLVGNYFAAKLTESVDESSNRFLSAASLFGILEKGMKSNVHVIIKQSLAAFQKILVELLKRREFISVSFILSRNEIEANELLSSMARNDLKTENLIQAILDLTMLANENNYWLVQSSYCELIASIDFNLLELVTSPDVSQFYEVICWFNSMSKSPSQCRRFVCFQVEFKRHLLEMLKSTDKRVRNAAADALVIMCKSDDPIERDNAKCDENQLIKELIATRIFAALPFPLCEMSSSKPSSANGNDHRFSSILFNLSNLLLEIDCKQLQLGVISVLTRLIVEQNPIKKNHLWNEFNVLDVSVSLLTENYATGTDLSCECSLIPLCTQLLAARVAFTSTDSKLQTIVTQLLNHEMKLLSIYHSVFIGQRPAFIPRSQKNDLFMNAKEIQLLNSRGYFGNDYFYLKIYKTIRVLHESYRVNVSNSADESLLTLLRTTLQSMSLLLELIPRTDNHDAELIKELLSYMSSFMAYATIETVECTRRLLRHSFSINFASQHDQYLNLLADDLNSTEKLEKIRQFESIDQRPQSILIANVQPQRSNTPKLFGVLSPGKSDDEKAKNPYHALIKRFEPIVVQSLRVNRHNGKCSSGNCD